MTPSTLHHLREVGDPLRADHLREVADPRQADHHQYLPAVQRRREETDLFLTHIVRQWFLIHTAPSWFQASQRFQLHPSLHWRQCWQIATVLHSAAVAGVAVAD